MLKTVKMSRISYGTWTRTIREIKCSEGVRVRSSSVFHKFLLQYFFTLNRMLENLAQYIFIYRHSVHFVWKARGFLAFVLSHFPFAYPAAAEEKKSREKPSFFVQLFCKMFYCQTISVALVSRHDNKKDFRQKNRPKSVSFSEMKGLLVLSLIWLSCPVSSSIQTGRNLILCLRFCFLPGGNRPSSFQHFLFF